MFILPLLSIYAQKVANLLIRLKNGLLIFLKILGKPNTAKMKKREDVYLAASFNLCAKGGKPFGLNNINRLQSKAAYRLKY